MAATDRPVIARCAVRDIFITPSLGDAMRGHGPATGSKSAF
jgi:hypothetical protein